jgi:AcrR family transcriptional regulator
MTKKRKRAPRSATHSTPVQERILDSASNLFYREGLRAVGIDRVLAEAGAAKASLYSHYSSKDELMAAYMARQGAAWRDRATAAVRDAGTDGREGLRRLFDLFEQWVRSPEFRGCPFLNAASELPEPGHPARVVARGHRAWLHELVRGLVESTGVTAPEKVSQAVVVLLDGSVATALLDDDPSAIVAAREVVERLLEEAPRPVGPPAPPRAV